MKFTLAMIAALVSGAAAGNLRAEAGTAEDFVVEEMAGQVQIGGLLRLPTNDELAVIDQVVMETYNHAYLKTNMQLTKSESKATLLLDDSETDVTAMVVSDVSQYVSQSGHCRWCPDDYDDWECYNQGGCPELEKLTESELLTVKTGNIHAKFEKQLCKKLRATGIANFAAAKECTFSVLENPGSFNTRLSEENAYETAHGKVMDAEVSMLGLAKELSADEMKVLESAVFDAHNDAFRSTGYKLTNFEAVSAFAAGEDLEGAVLVFARANPTVTDEDSAGKTWNLDYFHKAFEHAFCSKLKNTGLATFKSVHGCSFRFVHNPLKEEKTQALATAIKTVTSA